MKKFLMFCCVVAAVSIASTVHADQVDWSVGINAPGVGAIVSNGPVYVQPPVVYAPPPRVVHQPPRVVYQNPVVVYVEGPKKYKKHKKHKGHKGHDHAHRGHELAW